MRKICRRSSAWVSKSLGILHTIVMVRFGVNGVILTVVVPGIKALACRKIILTFENLCSLNEMLLKISRIFSLSVGFKIYRQGGGESWGLRLVWQSA